MEKFISETRWLQSNKDVKGFLLQNRGARGAYTVVPPN